MSPMNWPEVRAVIVAVLTVILMILGNRALPPNNPVQPPAPNAAPPIAVPPPNPLPIPLPPQLPPVAPVPTPNPIEAIVQTSAPGVGCSATIIGPRRDDGKYWILTAAHCVRAGGNNWKFRTRTGMQGGFHIVAKDDAADYAWGITDSNDVELPYANMCKQTPTINTPVFVAGYGTGYNGKRRDGKYSGCRSTDGQICFSIPVNHGDSGGGIMRADTGECISPVCCTAGLGRNAPVWGAAPEISLAGRPVGVDSWEWHPIPLPTKPLPEGKK